MRVHRGIAPLILNLSTGQLNAPAAFPHAKNRYPLRRRLDGVPLSRLAPSEEENNILTLPGFEHETAQFLP
jgi:hypothetical protein